MIDRQHKVTSPKDPNAEWSQQGYIEASYNKLYEAFGQSDYTATGVRIWKRDIDGVFCTIYANDEDLTLLTGIIETWSIGGADPDCVRLVKEALAERM